MEKKSCIDAKQFFVQYQGMEDVAKQIIQEFLNISPSMITNIELAIQKNDAKKLEVSAHTLKGAVSNFYAEKARSLAAELEAEGKNKIFTKVPKLFQDLKNELESVVKELNDLALK